VQGLIGPNGAGKSTLLVPNETITKAMREARRGNLEILTLEELLDRRTLCAI